MTGIKEDVEKKVYEWLAEVGDRIGAERVSQFLEGAIVGAARTKEAVDKNVDSLLAIANIPSRREYDRMRVKLDALQGSVMNLTRTVDRLRDRLAMSNGHAPAKPAVRESSARKRATKPRVKTTASAQRKRTTRASSKRAR